ncbi:hypothetical protein BKA82DRAFT_996345 [Pisolithus tinctorius]|uniref:Uncharacterized protein n=1 Tax=Pisolithus tinctorius Marx 270 TaxID=870435 RepID=A0A0C3JK25_PISTI|nr:hypothetical protein BKA82DRAFT_996345 [Pisolithus tinctorius]KIO09493.1 hypothetical protein M404DRAFT_996345 [Pisolithus tinctorius Marx 270]
MLGSVMRSSSATRTRSTELLVSIAAARTTGSLTWLDRVLHGKLFSVENAVTFDPHRKYSDEKPLQVLKRTRCRQ